MFSVGADVVIETEWKQKLLCLSLLKFYYLQKHCTQVSAEYFNAFLLHNVTLGYYIFFSYAETFQQTDT